ncbi:hypothetical protein [Streptomyces sp. VRA16 Mangrove soil]|uniref:hypothetical protein n=1 Tax=Streptomyces sp. VRA16 Mangrove soil TaxID=2817434 RepID=UPI001A9D276C|nr:hypothetical protein [Streptomyces sp. VRA16 Mangrove soil]MBO1330016.1 hypothetical protein [Streptomyces sp. VRA16 Mangrove soil]
MVTPVRGLRRRLPDAVPGIQLLGVVVLAAGVGIGAAFDPSALIGTDGYLFGAGLLLAVGLYGSTSAIERDTLRVDLRGVVAVVTLGVVLKAALIAGVMILAYGRPEYLVLGIAVAQIDPLSVAALGRSGRMSQRARSLLTAWASFDDPMTVLLTLYVAGYAYTAAGHHGTPAVAGGGARGYALGLLLNGALLAAVLLLWWAGRRIATARSLGADRRGRAVELLPAALLLVVMLLVAAAGMLMLAVALAGLVVRVRAFERYVGRAVDGAFLAAALALGLFLAQGVRLGPGILLGATAFAAQAVVALLVLPLFVRGLERRDRVALGLGQQNGITAILIALTLERDFPGTAGIVGPAVVTVNLLHGATNGLRARLPRIRQRVAPGRSTRESEPPEQRRTELDGTPGRPPGRAPNPVVGPLKS